MAKNGNKKKEDKGSSRESYGLKSQTKHGIMAIVFFVLALFFLMSAFGVTGVAGEFIKNFFKDLLGSVGYFFLPTLLILLGTSYIKSNTPNVGWRSAISGAMFLLSSLGILNIVFNNNSGGLLGEILSIPFVKLFDVYASIIFLGAILIISILVIFNEELELAEFFKRIWGLIRRKNTSPQPSPYKGEGESEEEEMQPLISPLSRGQEDDTSPDKGRQEGLNKRKKSDESEEEEMPIKKRKGGLISTYTPPPLSLLEEDQGKPNTGDIKANANIIKRTLQNFGIEVEMDEITIGPTVTRYALKPAEGMKLSRIIALTNDLSLALAAHPIRIEAPIPGKSLVGIEIPNRTKSLVGLATLLSDDKFQNSSKPLTIALGRNISGKSIFGNLAKMPHALVAGTTGSGKSVTIHSMITSLLYRNGPDDLKLILIDPKRVELTLYNNIPHLLTPVITEAKKTILALKWAAKEMDRRYDILESESVRDIESYHNNIYGKKPPRPSGTPPQKGGEGAPLLSEEGVGGGDRLPYIVIIIDELADIMSAYPRELESAIVRLAQMSRAVGIHLILSTQRPEVNVITGLIKANIPARIALKVSSQVDSRTILDAGGAEKLLGAGDMLYSSGDAQPERLQSAFISENEVKKVVNYLTNAYKDEVSEEITLTSGSISADKSIFESALDSEDEEDDDEMYEEARLCVIEAGKASTSYLQRKLKLGYARAARLMDKLEEKGVIGPGDGAKPREVLEKITHDETGGNVI